MTETIEGITVGPEKTQHRLNPRQLESYRALRRDLIKWMLSLGKEPEKANGYAQSTADTRARRLDKFYRWIWDQEGEYTETVTTDHADAWMKSLAHEDYTSAYKACHQKAVKTLFKWQSWKTGEEIDWDPLTSSHP